MAGIRRQPTRGLRQNRPRCALGRGGPLALRGRGIVRERSGHAGGPRSPLRPPDTRAVAGIARDTAVITHTHPEGVDGAVAQAVAVHRVLGLDPDEPLDPLEFIDGIRGRVTTAIFRDKLAYLSSSVGQRSLPELAQVLGSGVAAHASVPTALACFLSHPRSFPEAVEAAISLGGDTDTVAAMTGALAGARGGLAAIPPQWRSVEGYDTLKDLADELLSR